MAGRHDPRTEERAVTARRAKLRYVSCGCAGIRRVKRRAGFSYLLPSGEVLTDARALERIRRLALPPAWKDVWICLDPHGHLQATGIDARGRKQYRYDVRWRAARDELKYGELLELAEELPRLRRRLTRDMQARGLTRDKVLATLVMLLALTGVRVGNDRYRDENGSFGLTTLLDRHARFGPGALELSFRGKGGKPYRARVSDARLARIVRRCRDVPGPRLFQYIGEGGAQSIGAGDVNRYLRRISGARVSAKSFRTWLASVLALQQLSRVEVAPSLTARKRQLNEAIARVADQLGNTVAICRKSYVHPGLMAAFLADALPPPGQVMRAGLSGPERALVHALERLSRRREAA